MANVIIPKRSTVAGKVPATGDLVTGEIAINLTDKKLYSKDGSGAVIEIGGSATVDLLNVNSGISAPDYIQFDTGATNTPAVGKIYWDAGEGSFLYTLSGGNVTQNLHPGSELVYNGTGATLTKGQVVYLNGAQGQRPSVALALATSDSTSARTIGIVAETIANGAEGWIRTNGILEGFNTATFTEGAQLYLSGTVAGGMTATKPVAPTHLVYVARVIKSHATAGRILVGIQNGYELDEIHDVLITSPVGDNEVLAYNSATGLWKNETIVSALGYTPANKAGDTFTGAVGFAGNVYNTVGGAKFFANSGNINYLYAATSGLYVQNATDTANILSLTNGGSLTASADMRAPIFYDSDNTGYYVNPSAGNLSMLIAGRIEGGFGAYSTSGTLDWNDVSNTRSGSTGTLLLGTATNGPGPSMYFHPFNFEYNSKDGNGNVTQMAIAYGSPGNKLYMRGRYSGSWGSWVQFLDTGGDAQYKSGYLESGSSLRAPIFYDSNNTSYYVDAAGTSYLNDIRTGAGWIYMQYSGSDLLRMNAYGTGFDFFNQTQGYWADVRARNLLTSGGYVQTYSGGVKWDESGVRSWSMYPTGGGLVLTSGDGAGSFNILETGGTRSRIFYDYDNTSYYVDPASISNLNKVKLEGFYAAGLYEGVKTYTLGASGADPRRHTIGRIYYTPVHWGDWSNIRLKIFTTGYTQSYVEYDLTGWYGISSVSGLRLDVVDIRGLTNTNVRILLGSVQDSGWQYASQPVYYQDVYFDADFYNEARIVVCAETGVITNSNPASGTGWAYVFYDSPASSSISGFEDNKIISDRYAYANYDSVRAPVFYDIDNTAYWLDAAGNSVFSAFNVGGGEVYVYGSATNALGIRTGAGGAYKYFDFDASGNFHTQNGSVYSYTFYDKDNTAYYADPTGTSVFNALTVGGSPVMRGVGQAGATNINWNTLGDNQNTIYEITQETFNIGTGSGNSNYPTTASYKYGTLVNFGAVSSARAQMYISHAGNDLIFRGGWGTTSWQTWNKVLTDQNYQAYGNFGSYGVTASGVTVVSTGPSIVLRDSDSDSGSCVGYISLQDNGSTERGWIGYGTSGNRNLTLRNSLGIIQLYGSYALSESSHRAPIFYDSDNTNYYFDPTSGSTSIYTAGTAMFSDMYMVLRSNGIEQWATNGNAEIAINYFGYAGGTTQFRDFRVFDGKTNVRLATYGSANYTAATGSLRAPYFYDSDNTSYYVDAAWISKFYGLGIQGSANSTDTTNQLFLWDTGATTSAIGFKSNAGSFVNPTGFGDGYNTYLTMDTDGRGWVFRRGVGSGDFGAAYTSGWILNNGVWQANASMRAPVFYDKDDTNYYIDPASTSAVKTITFGSYLKITSDNIDWASGNYFRGASNHFVLGVQDGGTLYLNYGNSSGTYQTYGTGTHNGYATATSSFRAPVFYDSDDTNFYIDLAGNSKFKNIYVRNTSGTDSLLAYGSTFGYASSYKTLVIGNEAYTTTCIGVDPNGNVSGSFNGGGSGVEVMFKNGVTFISPNSANNSYNSNLYLADGYIVSNGSVRSPIFYDSNNTAYYVDPASTTYINQLQILGGNPVYPAQWTYGYHSSSDFVDGTLVVTDIDASVANGDSFVIEITGKTYDGSNPPVSVIAQGYLYNSTIIAYSGISIGGNFASYIKVFEEGGVLKFWWPRISYWNSFQVSVRAANGPTNNTISRNRVTSISNSTEPTGTKKVQINLAKNMRADVSATNSVDLRAPIFYDSNNTGYYVDPASTAGNAAYFAGGIHISGANVSGNGLILADDGDIVDMNDGYCSMRFSLGVRIRNGNRTGDPAYELNSVYGASSLENQRGFVINGNYTDGRYSTRLRKWDDGGGVPLYIQQTTSTAGSWSNVASFGSSNSRYAFHVDGIIYTGSDVRAPIFYDSDNTGYYINPNGTSAFNGKAIGVLQYTSTHGSGVYSGSVSNPPLQVYSEDGGTAMMSFHRSNAYAFNMGLDPDNYFRWGGWSAGSNRFVFDIGNGWGQAAASWRAPMFYDSNDTSYYIDPNSTGYSGVLRGYVLFGDYGAGIVGSYSSYRYQLVFAMGDSYKGSLDGTSVAGGYGLWYSHPNAGGVAANLSTHGLMNIVNGSWHASLAASTRAVDDMRAPIFYDLNNTASYLDPAGTSRIGGEVRFGGGGNSSVITTDGDFYSRRASSTGTGVYYFADGGSKYLYWDGGRYYFGTAGPTDTDVSFRAPIFYDLNDTGYYLDPNGTSNLYRTSTYLAGKYITGDWADGFRNTPTQSYNFHGDVSSGGPSGTWWFYESMRHSNSANYWGTQIAWGWEDNANRLMQRNVTSNSFSGWVEYLNTSDRTYNGNLYMTGSIRSTASDIRAPIFYDQNDTSYYANPNSESVLNTLTLFGELNLSAGTNYVDHSGTITFRNQGNYVNSATLTTGGDFTASGNVTAYSDISLKKNIELITNPIEKINSINGVTFERIDTGVKGTGVIAQEIEKVLPEVVIEDENGIKSVAYGNIVGLLIEAIKEQQSQINALESKMEEILAKLK